MISAYFRRADESYPYSVPIMKIKSILAIFLCFLINFQLIIFISHQEVNYYTQSCYFLDILYSVYIFSKSYVLYFILHFARNFSCCTNVTRSYEEVKLFQPTKSSPKVEVFYIVFIQQNSASFLTFGRRSLIEKTEYIFAPYYH